MNTEEANNTQVARITIDGLFGLYNHVIPLNKTDRITIVHGPNGVGKTVLFKLTDALLNMRLLELLKYPFQRFELLFTNGVRIEVMGGQQDTPKTIAQYENDKRVGEKISLAPEELKEWLLKKRLVAFSVEEPVHDLLIENWFDVQQKDTFNRMGSTDLYVQQLFSGAGLYSEVSSHLIAAQRLIREKPKSFRTGTGLLGQGLTENEPVLVETVLSYSRELSKSIESTLADYGRKSQELDQSFPKRLLQGLIKNFTESEIRERMKSVYARQERLQQLGLMAEAPQAQEIEGQIEGQLDDSKRPVMAVYLSDMDKKLQVLEGLADKIEILLTQVNEQFVNKELVLNEQHELAVRTSQGERLPLSILSSGEQHQIVLMYDLLFHVEPNTLVMIDEPELSLHMDWQERFIGNLKKIIAVSNIDIVLATHSPYIVNGHNDLLVPLSADPVAITHS